MDPSSNNVRPRHGPIFLSQLAPSLLSSKKAPFLRWRKKWGKSAWHERLWLMTISAIVWTRQTKISWNRWKKNRWTVLKKNGVNTAYSKCTCMFTKFISRFLMLCFFSHLHVLHYCCCEPKATNQRNVFWVRCKCHIWTGIIPVRKRLITMVYYGW